MDENTVFFIYRELNGEIFETVSDTLTKTSVGYIMHIVDYLQVGFP